MSMKLKELLYKILPCETVNIAFSSDYVIMGKQSDLLSEMEERDLLAEVLYVCTNEYGHIVIRADLVYYSELKERVNR